MSITAEHKSAAEQKKAAEPTTKLLHEIVIILNNGYAQRRDLMPELHYGQLVKYTTTEKGAKASMVFPDLSPYLTDDQKNTEILDSQIMELVRPYHIGEESFQGLCYLTLANGKRVGWDPDYPKLGGGDHRVGHP